MRMLLKMSPSLEKANKAIQDGSIAKVLQATFEKIKPEAAYFMPLDGKRTSMIFFDLKAESDVAAIIEPLLMVFDAEIELVPVMTMDDLQKGIMAMNG